MIERVVRSALYVMLDAGTAVCLAIYALCVIGMVFVVWAFSEAIGRMLGLPHIVIGTPFVLVGVWFVTAVWREARR